MTLGNTNHQFKFSVNYSMDLFGITIDKDLTLKWHTSFVCKNVNSHFIIMTISGKLMPTATMLCLYRTLRPHFFYSIVWHFFSKQDSDILDLLKKCIFPFILKDFNSGYIAIILMGTK